MELSALALTETSARNMDSLTTTAPGASESERQFAPVTGYVLPLKLEASDDGRTPGGGERAESVHFSSETVEWPTPKWLFDALDAEFGFTLDPCSTKENAKCARFYTRADNGLMKPWAGETVWMNPPYGSEIGAWMAKAHGAASHEGATVVCLVPARTDTAWWHDYAMKHEVRLLRGRITFEGATSGAPFPSAIIVMRPAAFLLVGWAVGDSAPDRERKGHNAKLCEPQGGNDAQ